MKTSAEIWNSLFLQAANWKQLRRKISTGGTQKRIFKTFERYQLQKGKYFNPHANLIYRSSRAESPTIVIKAVCDLMTNDHADTAVVERMTLAFAKEW